MKSLTHHRAIGQFQALLNEISFAAQAINSIRIKLNSTRFPPEHNSGPCSIPIFSTKLRYMISCKKIVFINNFFPLTHAYPFAIHQHSLFADGWFEERSGQK